jgi:hypothetical protein
VLNWDRWAAQLQQELAARHMLGESVPG